MRSPRVLISAGEVSGDRIGGWIAETLRERNPEVRLCGLGGPAMEASGVQLWAKTTHVGVIGLVEVIGMLPEIVRLVWLLRRRLREEKPAVAVLISCEGLNVPLAWFLRRRGIPTVSYFPPQVWMWRRFTGGAGLFFDLVLASFPEEYRAYRRSRARVEFVGHYLKDFQKAGALERIEEEGTPHGPRVALFPGSRRREFVNFTPILLDTALEIEKRLNQRCRFLLPLASQEYQAEAELLIEARQLQDRVDWKLSSREALVRADVGLIASGTASLEAALAGLPFVLFYQLAASTFWLVRVCQRVGLISDEWLGLPNLIAGREVVLELYQLDVCPSRLAEEAVKLWKDPARRERMQTGFSEISSVLGDGCSLQRVAAEVLEAAG